MGLAEKERERERERAPPLRKTESSVNLSVGENFPLGTRRRQRALGSHFESERKRAPEGEKDRQSERERESEREKYTQGLDLAGRQQNQRSFSEGTE